MLNWRKSPASKFIDVASPSKVSGAHVGEGLVVKPLIVCTAVIEGGCGTSILKRVRELNTYWDINVGWPGSVHDVRVYANTDIYSRGQAGTLFPNWKRKVKDVQLPIVLVGDPAYPLLPWIMELFS